MRGFAIFTIAIVGLIFTATSILFVVVPLLTLKYHLTINLKEKYEYDNADLSLLSLISMKYNDTYSMYRVVSEHTLNGFDESMQSSIRDKLILLTGTNCSKIVNTTATILRERNCEAFENLGEMDVFIPYNPENLIEKIILVYT